MSKKRRPKKKKQLIGRINPNLIKTRVPLRNDTIPHKNKKKLRNKYWGRKKTKDEEE